MSATKESMSNKDTFELLNGYPVEAVERALVALGYDPKANDFPVDIVAQVEGIIDSVGSSIDKVLQAAPDESSEQEVFSEGLVVSETVNLAGQLLNAKNVSIDTKSLVAVAQAMVAGGAYKARVLAQLQEQAFVQTLQQEQHKFDTNLLRMAQDQMGLTQKVFSTENLSKMVDRGVIKYDNGGFTVEEFLDEFKTNIQTQNALVQQRTVATETLEATSMEFDVDFLLDEVWGG